MPEQELKSNQGDFTGSSPVNALDFFIRSIIKKVVHTALPVVVTAVERSGTSSGAGYVTVKPLIQSMNVKGEGLEVTTIPKLPYFRLQHGTAAIVCDPKVGDVGLAVVAKNDISNVNGDKTPKVPATFRQFDLSDSFYIGGFWGQAPTVFVHLEDSGNIHIKATQEIKVEAPNCKIESETVEVNASSAFTVNSAQINLNGPISGGGSGGANATFSGDVKAKGISLTTHTHSGVQSGNSRTGGPQ